MEELSEILLEIQDIIKTSQSHMEEALTNSQKVLDKANNRLQTDLTNKEKLIRIEVNRFKDTKLYEEDDFQNCKSDVDTKFYTLKEDNEKEMENIVTEYWRKIAKEEQTMRESIEKFEELYNNTQSKVTFLVEKYKENPTRMITELQQETEPVKNDFSRLIIENKKDFSISLDRITLTNCELNKNVLGLMAKNRQQFHEIIRKLKEFPSDCNIFSYYKNSK